MRRNFKTGDIIINRPPQPAKIQQEVSALQAQRPVEIKSRPPSFKETAPGPRTFLGIDAFRTR